MEDWQGSGTVLVVDDEETIRNMACLLLDELGFDYLTASDGEEAIQIFRSSSEAIDLVIMDVSMPRMGGLEASRQLKDLRADLKVILTSGTNERKSLKAEDLSADVSFLQKPFEINSLTLAIRQALGG